MKLLKYIILLGFIAVCPHLSKASTFSFLGNTNFFIAGMEIICPDSDADGFFDDSCGGFDCDDSDELVNPFAVEICNDIDDDCDTFVDEGFDFDADGFTTCGGDCDDEVRAVNPGIEEWCFMVF